MTHDPIPALKQQLASELVRLIDGWNAWDIAVMIGTDQPRISDLRRGKLERFSLETLVRFLARLRQRVEVRVVNECRFGKAGGSPGARADGNTAM